MGPWMGPSTCSKGHTATAKKRLELKHHGEIETPWEIETRYPKQSPPCTGIASDSTT